MDVQEFVSSNIAGSLSEVFGCPGCSGPGYPDSASGTVALWKACFLCWVLWAPSVKRGGQTPDQDTKGHADVLVTHCWQPWAKPV
jgi:hypothetical protein